MKPKDINDIVLKMPEEIICLRNNICKLVDEKGKVVYVDVADVANPKIIDDYEE